MTKLILFGGKGGVGKTTSSASTAIWAAEKGYRTLIVSSDPAHSTRDSFGQALSPKPTKIDGVENLWGAEVDPDRIASKLSETMTDLIENEPIYKLMGFSTMDADSFVFPGMDEFVAFETLLEWVRSPKYDLVVFDTAPTGHTMRFLSLPDILGAWTEQIGSVSKRIDDLKGAFTGQKMDHDPMEEVRDKLNQIKRILTDPETTSFYIVLIPEMMAIEESRRAKLTLGKYGVPVRGCVINHVFPPRPHCDMCKARNQIQGSYLNRIHQEFQGLDVAKLPLFKDEVRGIDMLRKVGGSLSQQLSVQLQRSSLIEKSDNHFKAVIRYPGATKKDLRVNASGNHLSIWAVDYGQPLQFDLPFRIRQEGISSKLANGKLLIQVER